MAIIKCAKIETTQVAGGTPDQYGFTISVNSPTNDFGFLGTVDLNTGDGSLSAGDITIITEFIALVNAQLLAS
jgi:hypothetical protein